MTVIFKNDDIKEKEPFKDIYEDKQFLFPYDYEVREYPFYLDIEPTNKCNLNCIMCSRRNMTRDIGIMDIETYNKIISEIKGKGTAVRFVGVGEPLIHQDLVKMVKIANDAGITTFLSTNGLLLTKEIMEGLIDAGLDELRFSAQGVDTEGYKKLRKADYSVFSEKLRMASEIKKKTGSSNPMITLCTSILDEPEEQVEKFKKYWIQYADKIIVDTTDLNWVKDHEDIKDIMDTSKHPKVHKSCMDIMIKLAINWDGTAPVCCSDVNGTNFGDVKKESIHDIWHSKKFEHMRESVGRKKEHDKFDLCRNCYVYTDRFDDFKNQKKKTNQEIQEAN